MIYDLRTHKTYHLPLRVLLLPEGGELGVSRPYISTFLLDYCGRNVLRPYNSIFINKFLDGFY